MSFKRIVFFLLIVVVIILFFLNKKEVTLIQQDSFKLQQISGAGYEYTSVIHLHNPNLLSATIKIIDEKFFINGLKIAELNTEINQGIPGLKATEFPVSVRFTKSDYNYAIQSDTAALDSIEILMEGEIIFETMSSKGKINVHQTQKIALSNL